MAGPNKEADEKSAYNNVQVGDGPQHREIGSVISTDNASWRAQQREFRKEILQAMQVGGPQQREFRKEILQAMQVGKDNKFKIQCVTLICYYNDNLQNYMKNK